MTTPRQSRARAASPGFADSTAEFERLLQRADGAKRYVLKLYVTGTTPRSVQAIANIRTLCDAHLAGRYDLEVVDIYQQPSIAAGEQIIAAPTLVKKFPEPPRRLVGDFSDAKKVLIGLDLRASEQGAETAPDPKWLQV